jgi:hypothetical protein
MLVEGLVSTIIPIHNRPALLREAVASVLALCAQGAIQCSARCTARTMILLKSRGFLCSARQTA